MASKYHSITLCGGKSMMLSPTEKLSIPMEDAGGILNDAVLRSSKDMIEFMYEDVKLTIYANGSIMFYHFTDFDTACAYADEIIGMLTRNA
jgi:hypothetical protein